MAIRSMSTIVAIASMVPNMRSKTLTARQPTLVRHTTWYSCPTFKPETHSNKPEPLADSTQSWYPQALSLIQKGKAKATDKGKVKAQVRASQSQKAKAKAPAPRLRPSLLPLDLRGASQPSLPVRLQDRPVQRPICFKCGKPGHVASECTEEPNQPGAKRARTDMMFSYPAWETHGDHWRSQDGYSYSDPSWKFHGWSPWSQTVCAIRAFRLQPQPFPQAHQIQNPVWQCIQFPEAMVSLIREPPGMPPASHNLKHSEWMIPPPLANLIQTV